MKKERKENRKEGKKKKIKKGEKKKVSNIREEGFCALGWLGGDERWGD